MLGRRGGRLQLVPLWSIGHNGDFPQTSRLPGWLFYALKRMFTNLVNIVNNFVPVNLPEQKSPTYGSYVLSSSISARIDRTCSMLNRSRRTISRSSSTLAAALEAMSQYFE